MTIKWKKLHKTSEKAKDTLGVSWRTLAAENGLTASAFTRMSQEKPLSAVNLGKVLGIIKAYDPGLTFWDFAA